MISRGVKFLEKRRENVQIFEALRWRFDIWEAIFAVKNDSAKYRKQITLMTSQWSQIRIDFVGSNF
jgi:hypothetical protein